MERFRYTATAGIEAGEGQKGKRNSRHHCVFISNVCGLTCGLWLEFLSGVGISCLADLGRSEKRSSWKPARLTGCCVGNKHWLLAGWGESLKGQGISAWGTNQK